MSPKILYVAPLRDFSGYAHAARNYVSSLDALKVDIVTRDVIYDGGSYTRTEREEELFNRDTNDVDIIIQHTTPNETEKKEGVFNVNMFCWETDRIPPEWVNQLNQMDLVIVSCDENIKACRRSGVIVPIEKVPFAFDMNKYKKKLEPFSIPRAESRFKFLAICQYSKKKGVDALLKAYLSEFKPNEGVLLILKTYLGPNDNNEQKQVIFTIINEMKKILRLNNYPPIQLIHSVMSDDDVDRLYSTSDCYVLPSRGEGWSIPHFDAMAYGLPPIATNWGGPTEFITPECGWLIPYNMSPVCNMMHPFPYLYTAKDNWAEPHVCDLMESMREAFEMWKMSHRSDKSAWSDKVELCKKRANDFSLDKVGKQLMDTLMNYYGRWKNVH